MDDLDRLFQRLVHNIRNGHAEYLSVPFTVPEPRFKTPVFSVVSAPVFSVPSMRAF